MSDASTISRRMFLGSSARNAAGVAAGMVGLSAAQAESLSAADRVRVGIIGVRQQGRLLAKELTSLPGVEVASLCDVDERVLAESADGLADAIGRRPQCVTSAQRLFDDDSLDALVIATPDHSHVPLAIEALRAGKDLYLEQPATHRLAEHERLLESQRESGRIVQTGLPHRSAEHFLSAMELLRSGKLGAVLDVKAWAVYRRKSIGKPGPQPVPVGVDYSAWLGSAPTREFTPNRFHHNWHWFWDYGSGELGRSGVPLLDLACWGVDASEVREVRATGGKLCFNDEQETPDTLSVEYRFGRGYRVGRVSWEHRQWSPHGLEGRNAAVSFSAERGTLIVDRGGWKVYGHSGNLSEPASPVESAHLADWLDAIRTRRVPNADLEVGLQACTLCHLGNIAYREQRELRFDG